MKRILIAAVAAIGSAYMVSAASVNWKTYAGQAVYSSGTTAKLAGATAYLFDASVIAQSVLLNDILNNGKAITSFTSLASATTSETGTLTSIADPNPGTITAYFAIVSGDNIFISTEASGTVPETGALTMQFKGLNTPSKAAVIEFANASSYTGAGWYTAVPEPTSGLLMLLGMAGLALKRKRT